MNKRTETKSLLSAFPSAGCNGYVWDNGSSRGEAKAEATPDSSWLSSRPRYHHLLICFFFFFSGMWYNRYTDTHTYTYVACEEPGYAFGSNTKVRYAGVQYGRSWEWISYDFI